MTKLNQKILKNKTTKSLTKREVKRLFELIHKYVSHRFPDNVKPLPKQWASVYIEVLKLKSFAKN